MRPPSGEHHQCRFWRETLRKPSNWRESTTFEREHHQAATITRPPSRGHHHYARAPSDEIFGAKLCLTPSRSLTNARLRQIIAETSLKRSQSHPTNNCNQRNSYTACLYASTATR